MKKRTSCSVSPLPKDASCKHLDVNSAFTIPELLIATIIAASLTAVTAQVLISQLLEGRRLEVAQRVRENVSRLNYLIQIEASESDEIALGAGAAGCPAPADLDNAFTLRIPRPTGTYANPLASTVQFYNNSDPDGDHIWRCGPPVSRNGVLVHGVANQAGIVVRNAELIVGLGGGCQATTDRQVSYRVQPPAALQGANLGDLGGCVVAHARSYFVCNPQDINNPNQPGDCLVAPPPPGP